MNKDQFQELLHEQLSSTANKAKDRIYNDALHSYSKYNSLRPATFMYENLGNPLILFQLSGDMKIKHTSDQQYYPVPISIHFTENYPNNSPKFQILNPSPDNLKVHENYEGGNLYDGTYNISCLAQKSWTPNSNVLDAIQQVLDILANQFPFFKKDPQLIIERKQDNSSVRQQCGEIISYIGQSIAKDIKEQRSNLDILTKNKQGLDKEVVYLTLVDYEIKKKSDEIQTQLSEFNSFYSQNEQNLLTQERAEELISYSDPLSQQMIESTSLKNGLIDTYRFIEQKFNKGDLHLDLCMHIYRNLAEQEFDNQSLLRKCGIVSKK